MEEPRARPIFLAQKCPPSARRPEPGLGRGRGGEAAAPRRSHCIPSRPPPPPVGDTDGEVPGSAVLVFDIELLELVAGLPEGYMFVWNGEVSPNLFEEIDKDGDGEVLLEEVSGLGRKVGA